ncbi:MAG: hypothetical protein K940chlam7_01875 [Chlamydiae bacterium]|nr:hypothetical protein [Chlamydiota bacterium]
MEPPEKKIRKLKQELMISEQAYNVVNMIYGKREELENQINTIKAEIEAETFALHRKRALGDEDFSEMANKLEEKKDRFQKAQETKRDMDAKLDEYDIYSREMILKVKNELVRAILECHPDQKTYYENLQETLESRLITANELQEILTTCQEIVQALKVAIEGRQSVRGGGLLRFIFGQSPNVTITKGLQAAEKLAHLGTSKLKESKAISLGGSELKDLYTETTTALVKLQKITKKRWGYEKIDTEISPLVLEISALGERLQSLQDETSSEVKTTRENIDVWIEKMTSKLRP